MLDTGAACSIINYRAFKEIAQFGQPITVVRSKQLTPTYTGEVIPMLGSTTIIFTFDVLHPVELKIWITEAKTPNLLGVDFCRQLVSELHFDLPAIELKDSPNTIRYGNLCAINVSRTFQKSKQYDQMTQFVSMPKPPVYTNILARTTDILHPEHHSHPTKRQSKQDLPLWMFYVRNPKPTCQWNNWLKIIEITR